MTPVSIIIPAWNEVKVLEQTLEALLDIDYDKKQCEVIVVAGGEDKTYETAQQGSKTMDVFSRCVVIPQRRRGKNHAIQLGIKEAKNDIIVLLDADTIVSERWLKRMVEPIERGTCDLTIANPEAVRQNWITDYYMITKTHFFDRITWYPGHSIAFKAITVEKRLDYFFDQGTKVGVDYLLEKRFVEQGRKIKLVKDAAVKTRLPLSLKYFVLTELRWLTALISIEGVSYRSLAFNSIIVVSLILVIPFSKILFISALFFNIAYIGKRVRMFFVASRNCDVSVRSIFGFVVLSYVCHVVGFISHVKHLLGLSKTPHLYQGQRYN